MSEFYYNLKQLRNWAWVSLFLLFISLGFTATTLPEICFVTIIKLIALASALAAFYVYLEPQKLAQIDDEGIIIDHNVKLKWKDVEKVERVGKCRLCFCGREFLRFKLNKGVKYPLTFMQRLSAISKYGAFSIPLYAMTNEDAVLIEKEIDNHLKNSKIRHPQNKDRSSKKVMSTSKKEITKGTTVKKKKVTRKKIVTKK